MKFTLHLVAERPGDGEAVLNQETPLDGVDFLEEVGKCLRRSIDTTTMHRHVIIGKLMSYDIMVPQTVAIESGAFEDKDTKTLIVPADFLAKYIFHGASVSYGRKTAYPFYRDEAVLVSYIDELAVIEAWKNAGYPDSMVSVSPTPVPPPPSPAGPGPEENHDSPVG